MPRPGSATFFSTGIEPTGSHRRTVQRQTRRKQYEFCISWYLPSPPAMSTTISLRDLQALKTPVDAILHSIEGSIYRVSVLLEGREIRLLEADGKAFQRRSANHVREALRECPIRTLILRQHSAYDEMIGQAVRAGANTLEVSLGLDPEQS